MSKTINKKAITPKKTKAVVKKKVQKPTPTKKVKSETSKKMIYPNWTMPKHLGESDHRTLKRFYELFTQKKFNVALTFIADTDTIVREQIPPDVWKQCGGKLTKKGEEQLKTTTEKGKISPTKSVIPEKVKVSDKEENQQQKPPVKATASNFSAFISKGGVLQPCSTEIFTSNDEQAKPVEKNIQLEKEFEQLILANSKMLFGQHSIIFNDYKKLKDSYFPDKFLFDFRDVEKPRFYIVEPVLFVRNFGYFYARLTHFFAMFKTQDRLSEFQAKLCDIINVNKEQKDQLKP